MIFLSVHWGEAKTTILLQISAQESKKQRASHNNYRGGTKYILSGKFGKCFRAKNRTNRFVQSQENFLKNAKIATFRANSNKNIPTLPSYPNAHETSIFNKILINIKVNS